MRLDLGTVIPATAYIHAQQVRKQMQQAFARLFTRVDIIAGPAAPMRAGEAGTWTTRLNGEEIDLRTTGPEYTGIYNLIGVPALVLPAGFSSEDTPIGLQLAGRWFDEARVLQVAHAYEQATDWHRRRPPNPVSG
jgi:aspartyl-tRNA(Asn)/glutamyl-tRNA(Gln) amidotransferase subunit A